MTEVKAKVAVVGGAGVWGRRYLKAYSDREDCELVALVDKARDRREQFAASLRVPFTYETVAELLVDVVPDIVSIILPVRHSPAAVIACAEAGVKVISCEKPIAISLAEADRMVNVCCDRGIPLGCGNGHWESAALPAIADWIRAGNIGNLTGAAIPRSLSDEVSGGGCHTLCALNLLTGMSVAWAEGWTVAPKPEWTVPEGESPEWADCGAYGRLGLVGGIEVDIPPPPDPAAVAPPDWIVVTGDRGEFRLTSGEPVLIQNVTSDAREVKPDFLRTTGERLVPPAVDRLVRALKEGDVDVPCNGRDYRHMLEIAIAMKLSAQQNHRRVYLPLANRSLKIYPQPYRLLGGDALGWSNTQYKSPPSQSLQF